MPPLPTPSTHRRHRPGLLLGLLVVLLPGLLILTPPAAPARAPTSVPADSAPVAADRPNVVVVMADDMRVDDLDFAPNVRRLLVRDGLTFESSFSPFPLCCPARASFLTGTYAHNHHVYWHEAPYGYAAFDDSRTLATSLQEAGYRTGFVGKYLNGYGPMTSKVSGEPSYTYVPRGWDDWAAAFEDPGVGDVDGGTYQYFDTPYNVDGEVDDSHAGEYQTRTIGDFSTDFLRERRGSDQPFFLYASYVAPHHGGPVEGDDPVGVDFMTPAVPDGVRGRFDEEVVRPSGLPRRGPSEADVTDKPDFFAGRPEITGAAREALTEVTRQRAEAVHVLDRQVGNLVAELKDSGEWEDTVLVFTSDNGYFLGEHRQPTGKVRSHEPSLRVPLVVTGPGVRAGESSYDPISTVDLTATILDVAGARAPRPADGTSRWPTMVGSDRGWTTPVVTESVHTAARSGGAPALLPRSDPRSAVGVRVPRYSLTRYSDGGGELYDLRADPAQQENRFGDPAYAGVRRALGRTLRAVSDCAGTACQVLLPDRLRADPEQARALGERYRAVIDRRYGR